MTPTYPRIPFVLLTAVLAAMLVAPLTPAAPIADYTIRGDLSFRLPDALPQPSTGFVQQPTVFDVLADGRILAATTVRTDDYAQTEARLWIESAAGSRSFVDLGQLPTDSTLGWPSWGGAFLTVSPSGAEVAVGNNNGAIGVFSTAALADPTPAMPTIDWFAAPHSDAAWIDDSRLAVTRGDLTSAEIVLLDCSIPTPTESVIISGLLYSGGIAVDAAGTIYTGEGINGQVNKFTAAQWTSLAPDQTLDFVGDGIPVTQFMSAGSLALDLDGNLIVGGADYAGGAAASNAMLVYNEALALGRTFDPNPVNNQDGNVYAVNYNPVLDEIYVTEPFAYSWGGVVDSSVVHVLAVPEPASAVLLLAGLALLATGGMKRMFPKN